MNLSSETDNQAKNAVAKHTHVLTSKELQIAIIKSVNEQNLESVNDLISKFLALIPASDLGVFANSSSEQYIAALENLVNSHKKSEASFILGARLIFNKDNDEDVIRGAQLILKSHGADYKVPRIYRGKAHFLIGRIRIKDSAIAKQKEGAEHLKIAADLKFPDAFGKLYFAFKDGMGVPTNNVEAVKWLTLARLYATKNRPFWDLEYNRMCSRGGEFSDTIVKEGQALADEKEKIWSATVPLLPT